MPKLNKPKVNVTARGDTRQAYGAPARAAEVGRRI